MEWQTRKPGDMRERLKFAWLPVKCEDGMTRWLCKVRVVEEFSRFDWNECWLVRKAYRAEFEI